MNPCRHIPVSCLIVVLAGCSGEAASQGVGNSHRPAFLPGGDAIVFMSDRDGGDWELYRVGLDGSGLQRLTEHPGWDGYADVDPSGRKLVFQRDDDGHRGLLLVDLESGAEDWLVPQSEEGAGSPRFAPDGESILFAREAEGSREIFRLWLEPRRTERLTETPEDEGDPALSPDGRTIAYAVGLAAGGSALEARPVDGGEPRRLTTVAGGLYGVAWSPDGRTVYYNEDSDGDQEIFAIAAIGGTPRRLTDNDVTDHLPNAAPHGDRIVFTSERNGPEEIFVLDVASGAVTALDVGRRQ